MKLENHWNLVIRAFIRSFVTNSSWNIFRRSDDLVEKVWIADLEIHRRKELIWNRKSFDTILAKTFTWMTNHWNYDKRISFTRSPYSFTRLNLYLNTRQKISPGTEEIYTQKSKSKSENILIGAFKISGYNDRHSFSKSRIHLHRYFRYDDMPWNHSFHINFLPKYFHCFHFIERRICDNEVNT